MLGYHLFERFAFFFFLLLGVVSLGFWFSVVTLPGRFYQSQRFLVLSTSAVY